MPLLFRKALAFCLFPLALFLRAALLLRLPPICFATLAFGLFPSA